MNKRIKELMAEADRKCNETRGIYDEILAELIIRECIDNVKVWEKDSRNHISYMLKYHFGVVE